MLFSVSVNCITCYHLLRFHCPATEPSLDHDVILPLADDIQLSVAEYRNKLYEVLSLLLFSKILILQVTCHSCTHLLNSLIFFYWHSPRLPIPVLQVHLGASISQFHTVVIVEMSLYPHWEKAAKRDVWGTLLEGNVLC